MSKRKTEVVDTKVLVWPSRRRGRALSALEMAALNASKSVASERLQTLLLCLRRTLPHLMIPSDVSRMIFDCAIHTIYADTLGVRDYSLLTFTSLEKLRQEEEEDEDEDIPSLE